MSRLVNSTRSSHRITFARSAATVALSLVAIIPLSARPVPQKAKISDAATDPLAEGKGLFGQRCAVCHSTATKKYGPMLSKQDVVDREDEVRQQIEQGSALMPGFQYGLKSTQIDAIIGYLRTVEPPAKKVGTNNNDLPD